MVGDGAKAAAPHRELDRCGLPIDRVNLHANNNLGALEAVDGGRRRAVRRPVAAGRGGTIRILGGAYGAALATWLDVSSLGAS